MHFDPNIIFVLVFAFNRSFNPSSVNSIEYNMLSASIVPTSGFPLRFTSARHGIIANANIVLIYRKVVEAASRQLATLGHTTSIYMHSRFHEYADKLRNKLPKELSVVYMVNSGSEATDLAFLIARMYTRAQEVISLQNCYHGAGLGSAPSTAMANSKFPTPQLSGYIHVSSNIRLILFLTFFRLIQVA